MQALVRAGMTAARAAGGASCNQVLQTFCKPKEHVMDQRIALGMAMLAGAAFGAVAIDTLKAQNKAPGAYVVVDISEIGNLDLFNTLLPKAGPANDAFGGKYVIRTENISARDGTPPKRFVVISFDSLEKAKAWSASPAQKEVDAIREKSAKARSFIVDGTIQ
jgi:uncharacterized protein (DUF1330 family)